MTCGKHEYYLVLLWCVSRGSPGEPPWARLCRSSARWPGTWQPTIIGVSVTAKGKRARDRNTYPHSFISLAKTAMLERYVPRNAFFAWHDPGYDVIDQMLGGQGLGIFRVHVKKMVGMLYKKWWHSTGKQQKDITEKPLGRGVASTPCSGEG